MAGALKMLLILKSNSNCYSIKAIFWVHVFVLLKNERFLKWSKDIVRWRWQVSTTLLR